MAELCNEIQSAPPLKILKWPFKMPNFESHLEIGSHFDNDFAQLGSPGLDGFTWALYAMPC